jgi:hypothetical protein
MCVLSVYTISGARERRREMKKKRGSGIGIGMSRLVSHDVFDLDAGFGRASVLYFVLWSEFYKAMG